MKTLVIYDIVEDRTRNRVAEACKDYGLQRVQWSAFFGDLNHNRREELMLRLRRILGSDEGNIQAYPICDKDLRLKKEICVSAGSKKQAARNPKKPGRLSAAGAPRGQVKEGCSK